MDVTTCGRTLLAALLALPLALPGALEAQQVEEAVLPAPALVVEGGVFDLQADSADAGSWFALRLDFPLASWATLDAGVERTSFTEGTSDEVRWLLDFTGRLEWPRGRVHPYLGGSLGTIFDIDADRPPSEPFVEATYGAVGGVRVDLPARFGLRAEVRHRWFDGFDDRVLIYGGGVSWRF